MSNQPATPATELTSTIHLSSLRPVSEGFHSLEALSEEEAAVVSALPEGSAMLLVLSGPSKGSRFLLNVGSTSIGRESESEIFLDDITVSRKHARIDHAIGTGYRVKDLSSLNGTYLNGVATQEADLRQGDEIQIGKYKLTFFVKEGQ